MPGLVSGSRVAGADAIVGMKRTLEGEAAPSHRERPLKKQKVVHKLNHTQPINNIIDYTTAEQDPTRQHKEFFDHQLRRAIAIQCKAAGFDSARPEALERMRGMADTFMRSFLSNVRKSMTVSRRTETVPHDWIYALTTAGIKGSSILEPYMDNGDLPPTFTQPPFAPPEPAEPPPPDLEPLLGPELSGKRDKETRKYIPGHLPPFPPKHAWKATPVYTNRENDPRKIREKATEEGILAEQSLRKLMAAQKAGLQKNKARKQRKSKRIKESEKIWQEAMKELIHEEDVRAEAERMRFEDAMDEDEALELAPQQSAQSNADKADKSVNLQEGVHINYEQKFMRRSARGV